ncbi:uncharacterized protein A1O9_05113 [Exophiala aquamarina CBS 119918]|uniref:Sulfatase N-terminal domain-containing protein n=1 Tax=Exophiala aquamarina CBS 119918 TaxID=1182545 RepID=A0A072PLT5_9EURO|nr:uncharacterized protein A1O9_05113 [Exophiala aquamarina CBS 119918]KEF60263.1 hypothetical protein A1O9_05113 [Exophiala aquamarina CBS 119918]
MTDDQDLHQNSLMAQPAVQRELVGKGLTLENHFVTVAQCCPSRTAYLRGQAAHNTNLTHVFPPGGAFEKFVTSGQDQDYLPHWLTAANYNAEYYGKFMNGYSTATYNITPKGWTHTDILVNPYTYDLNNVVISRNGLRPTVYDGYHQSDILRAISLNRLDYLTSQDKPFYIQIAPTAPHSGTSGPPEPCARHVGRYANMSAPRTPNFNPPDEFQSLKPSYLKDAPLLNSTEIEYLDQNYRARLESLLGVDEMVEDIIAKLEEKGVLDNTYIIYTSDNGWHEGQHRRIGGKCLPYVEDTNVPMIIRGPGVPVGARSKVPSTHIDMAPTYLEIAGVRPADLPPFLDGRSLLQEWKNGGIGNKPRENIAREVLNVEYWGMTQEGADSVFEIYPQNNSYKTVRIVGDTSAWLFSRWCTSNDTELYNTIDDPYELNNLAISPTEENSRIISRLNGVLLITKSCSKDTCRNPWKLLATDAEGDFTNLEEAMDSQYDSFFASLPSVGFQGCLSYQSVENEIPFYPPESSSLGREYRNDTNNFTAYYPLGERVPGNPEPMGTEEQRHSTFEEIMRAARNVTDAEIGTSLPCNLPLYCADLATGGG